MNIFSFNFSFQPEKGFPAYALLRFVVPPSVSMGNIKESWSLLMCSGWGQHTWKAISHYSCRAIVYTRFQRDFYKFINIGPSIVKAAWRTSYFPLQKYFRWVGASRNSDCILNGNWKCQLLFLTLGMNTYKLVIIR